MDIFQQILQASSCNVDGSLGQNAFTNLVENILNQQDFVITESQALKSPTNSEIKDLNDIQNKEPQSSNISTNTALNQSILTNTPLADYNKNLRFYLSSTFSKSDKQDNINAKFHELEPSLEAHSIVSNFSIEDKFQFGKELYLKGNVIEALKVFSELVQLKDDHDFLADAWYFKGRCHSELDDDRNAIKAFESSLDYDPYHLQSLYYALGSYINECQHEKALETLKIWLSHHPTFSKIKYQPDLYSDNTLFDEIMQILLEIEKISPMNAQIFMLLGIMYNMSDNLHQSIDYFKRSFELNTEDYDSINKLAATLANCDLSKESLQYYQQILSKRPQYLKALTNLGIAYSNLNEPKEAIRIFLNVLEINPQNDYLWDYIKQLLEDIERPELYELCCLEKKQLLIDSLLTIS